MSIPDKQSGGVPPSSTPNAAPNTNPMPAMSPFAAHFQEQRERKKNMLMRHIDRISLSSKLVACTIAVLLIGVSVISFSIRALVNNYMLQKTDTQLSSQSQLVVNNIDLLSKNDSSGPNSYFLQIQYTDGTKDKEGNPLVVTPLMPQMQDGIVSVPILPTYGDTNGITLGQAFTTQAVAKQIITVQSDSADSQNDPANGNSNSSDTITKVLANPTANANHAAIVTARAPWRILPVTFQQNGKDRAVVYIGLSLADQIDTVNTLTRYCIGRHRRGAARRLPVHADHPAHDDAAEAHREDRRENCSRRPEPTYSFRAGKHRGRLSGRLAEFHAHPNRIQFP